MELLHARCAGLDVHKKTVVACRVYTPPQGPIQRETRTFRTVTGDLLTLRDWLEEWGCTHVALESTGEYWRPVYNLLEGHLEILVVNARHMRNVPGRKTDVKDAEWLADLLRFGLVRASFVPPKPQRQLRALTRQRSNLVAQRAMVVNWIQKVLEDANIKLACVATDITGVSGRAMLAGLIAGVEDPVALAEHARTQMRKKRPELAKALDGRVEEHHRFLLRRHLIQLDFLEEQITAFAAQIDAHLDALSPAAGEGETPGPGADATGTRGPEPPAPPSYREALQLIDPIPGIDVKTGEAILAELGPDMRQFPTAGHASAWAGVAPNNRGSGGKRLSGRTTHGNQVLKKTLVQAAHGACRVKGSYFHAQYQRLAGRRGKKRAIVAVAHSLLVTIYHVLRWREPYQDLGSDYFDERKKEATVERLVKRIEQLGHTVTLSPQPPSGVAAVTC